MSPPKARLTPKEAAVLVDRDISRIYRWIQGGRLESSRDSEGITTVATKDVLSIEAELYVTPNKRPTRRTES